MLEYRLAMPDSNRRPSLPVRAGLAGLRASLPAGASQKSGLFRISGIANEKQFLLPGGEG